MPSLLESYNHKLKQIKELLAWFTFRKRMIPLKLLVLNTSDEERQHHNLHQE